MAAAAPWIAMGLSTAVGLYGANQSAQAAKDAAKMQQNIATSRLQFDQQKYNRYLGIYGPLEEQQARDAVSPGPLDYGLIRSNIDRQYLNAGKGLTAQANRSGTQGMGLEDARQLNLDIEHQNALSTAYGQGLQQKRNYGLSVMNHNQLPNAGNAYDSALSGLAGMYGTWRGDANNAAAGAWSGVANALSGIGRYYMANPYGGGGQANAAYQSWLQSNAGGVPYASTGTYQYGSGMEDSPGYDSNF